jgi:hypothetical protein
VVRHSELNQEIANKKAHHFLKTSRNWCKPRKWCAFLFNVKIGYTAKWHLFATPDYLGSELQLNEYETAPYSNQLSQNLTLDCLSG